MPSPNNVLTADSYIQDGLVFQLDGIEYGGRADGWLDRKGNNFFFSPEGDNLHNNNRFTFGVNKWLRTERAIQIPSNSHVEIVTSAIYVWGNVINFRNSNFVFTNVHGQVIFQWGARPYYYTSSQGGIVSSFNDGLIRNGVTVKSSTTSTRVESANYAYMGRLNPSQSTYWLSGSIYAIRVYSRQLSDREILINQKIDNARFGLGLNIPDEVLPATRTLSLSEPFELPDDSMTEQDITNENSDER